MKKNGQSFLEYALLIGCISLALLAMQAYFKRGIQGVVKATSDDLASPGNFSPDGQQIYGSGEERPYNQTAPMVTTQEQEIVTTELASGERGFVINKDLTTTNGSWAKSYELRDSDNYRKSASRAVDTIGPTGKVEEMPGD